MRTRTADATPPKKQLVGTKTASRLAKLTALIAVLSGCFLFALDSTIVAVVQSPLIHDFGHIDDLPWISVAYQLGSTSFCLIWARCFRDFNPKYTFMCAVVLFEAGSAICGSAPNLSAFIVGRVICGLGGNGLYNGNITIISKLYPAEQRPLYLSFLGIVWGAGTVCGPLIGGALTTSGHSGWRWCFYLNLLVAIPCLPAYVFLVPSFPGAKGQTKLERLRRFDFFGFISFMGATVAGVIALSSSGAKYEWSSANIIVPLVFSLVLFVLFIFQQRFSWFVESKDRAFPVHLLAIPENWFFVAICAAGHATQFIPIFYIPLYFQFIDDYSALRAGIQLLPMICFMVFFVLLNGALILTLGYYTPWFIGGSALVIVGSALMSTVSAGTAHGAIYGFTILVATGVGAFAQAPFPIVQTRSPPAEMSNVITLLVVAQRIGVTTSLSVAGTMFLNRAQTLIEKVLPSEPTVRVREFVLGGSSSLFSNLSLMQKAGVSQAIATALDDVWYLVLSQGVLCLVCSFLIKHERLVAVEPKPTERDSEISIEQGTENRHLVVNDKA